MAYLKAHFNFKLNISYKDIYRIQTVEDKSKYVSNVLKNKFENKLYRGFMLKTFDPKSLKISDIYMNMDNNYIIIEVDFFHIPIHSNFVLDDFIVRYITSDMISAERITGNFAYNALIKITNSTFQKDDMIDILIKNFSIDSHNIQNSIIVIAEQLDVEKMLDFSKYYYDAHLSSYNYGSDLLNKSTQQITSDGKIYNYDNVEIKYSDIKQRIEKNPITSFYFKFNTQTHRYKELLKYYINPSIIGKVKTVGKKLNITSKNTDVEQIIYFYNRADKKKVESTFIKMKPFDMIIYDGPINDISSRIKSVDIFKPICSLNYFCIIRKQTRYNDTLRELSIRKLLFEIIRLINLVQIIERRHYPIPKDISEKYKKFYLEYIK